MFSKSTLVSAFLVFGACFFLMMPSLSAQEVMIEDLYYFSGYADSISSTVFRPEDQAALTLAPNPARDRLSVTALPDHPFSRIDIYATNGSRVATLHTDRPAIRATLNVSHLPPGYYVLSVQAETGLQSRSFVIGE